MRRRIPPLVDCVHVRFCGNRLRSWSRTPVCSSCVARSRLGPIVDGSSPQSLRDYLRERREREAPG